MRICKSISKIAIITIVYFIAACNGGGGSGSTGGSSGGGSTGAGSTGGSSSGGGTFGSCTVTGNMASFDIKCTKDIKNIQMGGISAGAGINLSMGGKTTKIDKIDAKTLKGSASGHAKLEFTINHIDGSTSDITVK